MVKFSRYLNRRVFVMTVVQTAKNSRHWKREQQCNIGNVGNGGKLITISLIEFVKISLTIICSCIQVKVDSYN